MGAAMTSVKFYLVGKASFTRTGYLAHRASFPQYANANDIITQIPAEKSLAGKNYLVTGANSGIGKEVAQFLYNGGATVHLVCRRQDAAEKAKEDIMRSMPSTESEGSRLPVYIADCGLEKDMRRLRSEFSAKTLDGLICNAGKPRRSCLSVSTYIDYIVCVLVSFSTFLYLRLHHNWFVARCALFVCQYSSMTYNCLLILWYLYQTVIINRCVVGHSVGDI